MSEYADRDIIVQGEHYVRHVSAMTSEDLHDKSDIAAELAHRDIEIERLTNELAQAQEQLREAQKFAERIDDRRYEEVSAAEAKNHELAAQVAVMQHTLKMIAIVDEGCGGNLTFKEMAESAMRQAKQALTNLPSDAEKLMRLVEAVKEWHRTYGNRFFNSGDWAKEHTKRETELFESYRDLRGEK